MQYRPDVCSVDHSSFCSTLILRQGIFKVQHACGISTVYSLQLVLELEGKAPKRELHRICLEMAGVEAVTVGTRFDGLQIARV